MKSKKTILVTGAAGFIGYHLCEALLKGGHNVIGLDNINDYYDVRLKQARLAHIGSPNKFHFHKLDLVDCDGITSLFADAQPEIVINLAAQAGVRYSLQNPHSYINSNLVGFTNILEACRHFDVGHLVYASSSSVYGLNEEMPFHEGQNTDHPLALYGATKRQMSYWHIVIVIYSICRQPDYGYLRSMVPGAAQTWLRCCLRMRYLTTVP